MENNNMSNVPEKEIKAEDENQSISLESLKLVIDDLKTRNLILLADMENLRKRFEKDKKEIIKYSSLGFLQDLLPTLEMFELALNAKGVSEETKKWLMGFEMILKNISLILKNEGVEKINLKVGDLFDSSIHFAIETKNSNVIEKDHIISINQSGYKLYDKLIKPAFVVVSNGKSEEENIKE